MSPSAPLAPGAFATRLLGELAVLDPVRLVCVLAEQAFVFALLAIALIDADTFTVPDVLSLPLPPRARSRFADSKFAEASASASEFLFFLFILFIIFFLLAK